MTERSRFRLCWIAVSLAGVVGAALAIPQPAGDRARPSGEPPEPRVRYRFGDGGAGWVPLDRQAVLQGPVEMRADLAEPDAADFALTRFAVAVGAKPLCSARLLDGICRFDFDDAPGSWTLRLTATLRERATGATVTWERTISTLEARLEQEETRFASSGARIEMQERAETSEVPYDEIRRLALVTDARGRPRRGLTPSDFELRIAGVKGESIVAVRPMGEVESPRLLFLLVDVSEHLQGRKTAVWRETWRPLVDELVGSLRTVTGPGRKLLVVRYGGSAQASPILDLDAEGIEPLQAWLLRPPPASWRPGEAGRTSALLQAYDVFLHGFHGQALGLVISGGRDNVGHGGGLLDEHRIAELNPVWPDSKRDALLAELDAGLVELFPHTAQRGFPLSWVYVPGSKRLTRKQFEDAARYFHDFGGEVYRLARLGKEKGRGARTRGGGTLWLDELLLRSFEELEASYQVDMRVPNPRQRRVDRTIELKVPGARVRTQRFYRPSESLQANIERYINSASKERRLRAAYAARDYPLDGRIYEKVRSWLPEEPSPQVRPVLEESLLLMTFKRAQASERAVRREARASLASDIVDSGSPNRSLLETLRQLVARMEEGDDEGRSFTSSQSDEPRKE